jgi:predicted lipid-binding transport protein (Tim44 family)
VLPSLFREFAVLRPVLGFAAIGLVGILLLPLFGALIGVVFFLLKIALVIFAIWFVMRLFRNKNKSDEATAD